MASVAVHTGDLSNFRLEGRLAAARESYLGSWGLSVILAEQKIDLEDKLRVVSFESNQSKAKIKNLERANV